MIGSGIELNVNGGLVSDFRASTGSEVNLNSGTIEGNLELRADSQANFNGGSFRGEILAESGSQINVNGGDFGGIFGFAFPTSDTVEVNVTGGNINGMFGGDIDANISGGSFTSLLFAVAETANANISGGNFSGIEIFDISGTANLSGGTFDGIELFSLNDDGELNLVGSDFFLNGVALNDLTPGEATLISDRDVILSGLLSDGSPFEFDLNTTPGLRQPQIFSPNARLTVSLAAVPEPTSSVILSLAGLMALCSRRRN